MASCVANTLENDCENANTYTHGGVHLVVGTFEQGLGTLPVECLPVEYG